MLQDFERTVFETTQSFKDVKTAQDCWQVAIDVVHRLGGNALNVGGTNASGTEVGWARSSMSKAWLEEYERQGYLSVDPFVAGLLDGRTEAMADCGSLPRTDPAYNLNHGLKAHGYGSLYASMSGSQTSGYRSICVFCSEKSLSDVRQEIGFNLISTINAIITVNLATQTDTVHEDRLKVRDKELTAKEQEVLNWLASGLRNDQIAFKAKIAEVTVRKYLISIRKKVGASTREQAIAIAIRDGWL